MAVSGFDLDALLDALAAKVAEKLNVGSAGQVNPRLLTVEQAAGYLGRSPHGVRRLIRSAKLPVVRLDDRIFLDLRDLDHVIDEAKQVAL